jgi:hypothetical protein
MRTLFLNPPLFEIPGASRPVESYWYPVRLCCAARMLPASKVADAPPHRFSALQTIEMARDYDLVCLFTSAPGLSVDLKLAEMMKGLNPDLKVGFVGPSVTDVPGKALQNAAVDFVVRGEFAAPVAGYAAGQPLEALPGVSFVRDGAIVNNPNGHPAEPLDGLPWIAKTYQRDLDIMRYKVPFLQYPYLSLSASHGRSLRSTDDVAAEVQYALTAFPMVKEIFFDDTAFTSPKSRALEICAKLKPLKFTWSSKSPVTADYETLQAMKASGCRLLMAGCRPGDSIAMAQQFAENCSRLGLVIHGDFTVGLPDETAETLRRTLEFARCLDPETLQLAIAGGAEKEVVDAVAAFYREHDSRSRAFWRVSRKVMLNLRRAATAVGPAITARYVSHRP